eukprot:6745-Heterococcus_DN1.PRE.1
MTDAAAKRELEALMERSRRSYSSKLSALQAEVERTAGYDAAVATAASAAAAEQAAQEQLKELRFELAGAEARLREVERRAHRTVAALALEKRTATTVCQAQRVLSATCSASSVDVLFCCYTHSSSSITLTADISTTACRLLILSAASQ